jgi:spore coat protein A, manganese oxidase
MPPPATTRSAELERPAFALRLAPIADLFWRPGRLAFTGPRVQPPANERRAAKDMVQAFPGEVTRIIAKFDLPAGTHIDRGERFRYVLHCHILEHEDNDMMRPYDVVG